MSICLNLTTVMDREVDLHRAVIRQAIYDAQGEGVALPQERAEAFHFLTSDQEPWSSDRETVCALALVDEFRLVQWARETLPRQPAPPPLDAGASTLLELFADEHTLPLSRLAVEFEMKRADVRNAVARLQVNGWHCWLDSKTVYRWDRSATAEKTVVALSTRTVEEKRNAILHVLDRPLNCRQVAFAAGLNDSQTRETIDGLVADGLVVARTRPALFRITAKGHTELHSRRGGVCDLLKFLAEQSKPVTYAELKTVAGKSSIANSMKEGLVQRLGKCGDDRCLWYTRAGERHPFPEETMAVEPAPPPPPKPKPAPEPKPKAKAPPRSWGWHQHRHASLRKSEARLASVLDALRHGPATAWELRRRLKLSDAAVHRALQKLEKRGLVQHRKRMPVYRVTDAGRDVLAGRRGLRAHRNLLAEIAKAGNGGVAVAWDDRRGIGYLKLTHLIERIDNGPVRGCPPREYCLADASELEVPTELAA